MCWGHRRCMGIVAVRDVRDLGIVSGLRDLK